MSYRIEYSTGCMERKAISKRKRRWPGIAGALGLFLVLTVLFWPQGRAALRDFLLPGNPAVTADALKNLAADLQSGESLSEAATAFCQQIIEGSGCS